MSDLHYVERGDPGAPTVVIVHGFMGTGADFETLIAPCVEGRHFVVIDLPGHGKSMHCLPGDRCADLAWMAGQLAAFLKALPQESVELFGYSMGGRIALYTALYFGDKIQSLTLESASPGLMDEGHRRRRRALDAERAERLRSQPLKDFLDDWYAMELFASLKKYPEFDEMMKRRLQQDGQAMARVIEEMSPGAQPDLWPELHRLTIPTRWIAGGEDAKYVDICTRAARKSGGRVQIVENAGHTVHLQSPQKIRRSWLCES